MTPKSAEYFNIIYGNKPVFGVEEFIFHFQAIFM